MATDKSNGGLGFRNLHGFNIALLGKHIWKFCHNPTSLVARVFKGRYFPDNHVLQAQKGNDLSFIWTGIWEAKESLCKGFRWVLGDGKEIRAFKNPLLRGKGDFCVEDSHLNSIRNERVFQFFRPDSRDWDVQKVQQNFHVDDIQIILQTRIPQCDIKDRIAWLGSCNGEYTVKTGYRYWASQLTSTASVTMSKGWNKIWQVQLPHKVKTFLWRFCKNTILVRKLLRSKGWQLLLCVLCVVLTSNT